MADESMSLHEYLADRLGVAPEAAAALIERGAAYINGKRAMSAQYRLRAGDHIVVHHSFSGSREREWQPAPVFEDNRFLIVDKPAGLPSQATRDDAQNTAERAVWKHYPNARLMHRLDRDTRGLLAFALTAPARQTWTCWITRGEIERKYIAAVCGVAPERGEWTQSVGPDPRDSRRQTTGLGRRAVTRFERVWCGHSEDGCAMSVLRLSLLTGRTHQIRVHAAAGGHPLCGDPLYGSPGSRKRSLALLAGELRWPGGGAVSALSLKLPTQGGLLELREFLSGAKRLD